MTLKAQNVEHWSGDDLVIRFTVKDAAGAAVDLDGASARWFLAKVATSRADSNILIRKSTDDDQEMWIDQPATFHRIHVRLVPSDTEDVAPNANLYHECEVVLASGEVLTVAIGKMKLNPTVIPST